jgi:hypothetical protein
VRKLLIILSLLFVILLIANVFVGDSQDGATDRVEGEVDPATFSSLLHLQPEAEKIRLLRSAINTAGYPCRDVTTIQFNGSDDEGAGYWAVACADGGNWMVQVRNDAVGSTSVTSCEILRALRIKCWEKF